MVNFLCIEHQIETSQREALLAYYPLSECVRAVGLAPSDCRYEGISTVPEISTNCYQIARSDRPHKNPRMRYTKRYCPREPHLGVKGYTIPSWLPSESRFWPGAPGGSGLGLETLSPNPRALAALLELEGIQPVFPKVLPFKPLSFYRLSCFTYYRLLSYIIYRILCLSNNRFLCSKEKQCSCYMATEGSPFFVAAGQFWVGVHTETCFTPYTGDMVNTI